MPVAICFNKEPARWNMSARNSCGSSRALRLTFPDSIIRDTPYLKMKSPDYFLTIAFGARNNRQPKKENVATRLPFWEGASV